MPSKMPRCAATGWPGAVCSAQVLESLCSFKSSAFIAFTAASSKYLWHSLCSSVFMIPGVGKVSWVLAQMYLWLLLPELPG